MAYTTDIRTAHTGIFGRFADFRRVIAERASRYALYRQTLAELHELSDRDLRDLGIHRTDIEQIAWTSAKGN
jgi:uncharacterized protein YjiS (DUF1127 family)